MFDSAYSLSTSNTDAKIQRKLLTFKGNVRSAMRRANAGYAVTQRDEKKARRANADNATTERDSNKDSKRAPRAKADYSTTERDANEARRAIADYAATERVSNKDEKTARLYEPTYCQDEGATRNDISCRVLQHQLRINEAPVFTSAALMKSASPPELTSIGLCQHATLLTAGLTSTHCLNLCLSCAVVLSSNCPMAAF
jgi:hypothetical protein